MKNAHHRAVATVLAALATMLLSMLVAAPTAHAASTVVNDACGDDGTPYQNEQDFRSLNVANRAKSFTFRVKAWNAWCDGTESIFASTWADRLLIQDQDGTKCVHYTSPGISWGSDTYCSGSLTSMMQCVTDPSLDQSYYTIPRSCTKGLGDAVKFRVMNMNSDGSVQDATAWSGWVTRG